MRFVPRICLRGKRSSEEQIAQEISDLLYGKSARPYPLSVSETARLLGVCRSTVYSYLKRMQRIEKSHSGRFRLTTPSCSEVIEPL